MQNTNTNYIISKANKTNKLIELQLFSTKYNLLGKIDQVLFNEKDNTAIILEIKHSFPFLGKTLIVQLALESILIRENMKRECNEAFVEFVNSNNRKLIKVNITEDMIKFALNQLKLTNEIIKNKRIPYSIYNNRCIDCQYRKICPVGILKKSL